MFKMVNTIKSKTLKKCFYHVFFFSKSQFEGKTTEVVCKLIVDTIWPTWRMLFTGWIQVLLCSLNLNNYTIQPFKSMIGHLLTTKLFKVTKFTAYVYIFFNVVCIVIVLVLVPRWYIFQFHFFFIQMKGKFCIISLHSASSIHTCSSIQCMTSATLTLSWGTQFIRSL